MKQKEKWAKEYVDSIKDLQRRPGLSDVWIAGFEFAKKEIAKKENNVKGKDIIEFGDNDLEP